MSHLQGNGFWAGEEVRALKHDTESDREMIELRMPPLVAGQLALLLDGIDAAQLRQDFPHAYKGLAELGEAIAYLLAKPLKVESTVGTRHEEVSKRFQLSVIDEMLSS